ncbi:hypothetical protein [Streptomyces sp. MI02-7b]|uniref:hypothetical protein n=1 Tax=Streptomyces sp. MI02-7b TaxID=462941 RepID=UPI00299FD147|nr:hypothetical protein [Streptomyces sp. MI02-7b]MDX3075909.1 hypothetical protein [Streptomyces sp. MI02-7b]
MHPYVSYRDVRYLRAAHRGHLNVLTEFEAVRGFVDTSDRIPSYLGPAPAALLDNGWLVYRGERLALTAAGRRALGAYDRHLAELTAQPSVVTRNPLKGELHDPAEPLRRLRHAHTGAEIPPGDTVRDSSGLPVTYLGPTMSSHDNGRSWLPGFNARVHYPAHGPWLLTPAELRAVYDPEPPSAVDGPHLTGLRPA